LSTILNNVVEPESGVTVLFNIVDSYEQCGQQNIVQSCFHQYCINLSVFRRVPGIIYCYNFLYLCIILTRPVNFPGAPGAEFQILPFKPGNPTFSKFPM
jgi:hypothetical protein